MILTCRDIKLADQTDLYHLANEFPSPTSLTQSEFSKIFSQRLLDENSYTLVAEKDNELIGYLSGHIHSAFYAGGKVGWLDEIMVIENYRNLGVGKQLMSYFENWAKDQGCVLISLATIAAAKFYESQGYASQADYYKKYM